MNIILEMCPTSNIQTKAILLMRVTRFVNFYKDGIKGDN